MTILFTSPFPPEVAFEEVEIRSDLPPVHLGSGELSLLHPNASQKRIREFSAGRLAARNALEKLGLSAAPAIRLGKRGEPVWPENYVGSISHSERLAVAVAASKTDFRGVGIDLQSLRRAVNEEIARRICHPQEILWCRADALDFQTRLMTIFSAKETLFKALYPLTEAVFYFLDAELRFDETNSSCQATLLKDLSDEFRAGSTYRIGVLRSSSMILTHMLIATGRKR